MTSLQRRSTGDRAPGLRRSINLSLDAALLDDVQLISPDLSATIEALLAEFLERRTANQEQDRRVLEIVVEAVNRLHERTGFLSDSFSTL